MGSYNLKALQFYQASRKHGSSLKQQDKLLRDID